MELNQIIILQKAETNKKQMKWDEEFWKLVQGIKILI